MDYTSVTGADSSGDAFGYYHDMIGYHAFVRSIGGTVTTIDLGDGTNTYVIDSDSAGNIFGTYYDNGGAHGFVRSINGEVTTIDVDNSNYSAHQPVGIDRFGDIFGTYNDDIGVHGFSRSSSGIYTDIDLGNDAGTYVTGADSIGDAFGYYYNIGYNLETHGFVRDSSGHVTIIDVGTDNNTYVNGADSAGDCYGTFTNGSVDNDTQVHGFVRDSHGVVTTIDIGDPNNFYDGNDTYVTGVDGAGDSFGYYQNLRAHTPQTGFVRSRSGVVTTVDFGSGSNSSIVTGVDSAGNAFGVCWLDSVQHGFMRSSSGVITTFDAYTDTQPPQVTITNASYNTTWSVTGTAEAGSQVSIRDGSVLLGTTVAAQDGAWNFVTNETNSAIRAYTATATDAAQNTSESSAAWIEGTGSNDTFKFVSETALTAPAALYGNGGADAILLSAPVHLVDLDFAAVHNVQTLRLTGASSDVFGAASAAAGLKTIVTGKGTTSIASDNAGTLAVNAGSLMAGASLILSGHENFTVSRLQHDLVGTGVTGKLSVTTGTASTLSIDTGSGKNVIAAGAMTVGETLQLTGSHAASVTAGANLSAGAYTAPLTVVTSGASPHAIATGSGKDVIKAYAGRDRLNGGAGSDKFDVIGHGAADIFVYNAIGDSAGTQVDLITGFSDTADQASFNDVMDLSGISGIEHFQGALTTGSQKVEAGHIAWRYNATSGQTVILANSGTTALSQTSSSLLHINLSGGNFHLSSANFIVE